MPFSEPIKPISINRNTLCDLDSSFLFHTDIAQPFLQWLRQKACMLWPSAAVSRSSFFSSSPCLSLSMSLFPLQSPSLTPFPVVHWPSDHPLAPEPQCTRVSQRSAHVRSRRSQLALDNNRSWPSYLHSHRILGCARTVTTPPDHN